MFGRDCTQRFGDILNGTYHEPISLSILQKLDLKSLKALRLCQSTLKNIIHSRRVKFEIPELETAIAYADRGFKVKYNAGACIAQKDVKRLSHIYDLDLSHCGGVTDVSVLGRGSVHTLNITYCNKITNVDALQNVRILNLSWCEDITDINPLLREAVHTLNLTGCSKITDISDISYSAVHTLILSFCNGIRDISAIRHSAVHTLNLSYCHHLTFWRLDLTNCNSNLDLSPLIHSNFDVVDFDLPCATIADLNTPENLRIIYLDSSQRFPGLEELNHIKVLWSK
jgi:hypothetical protein